MSRAKKKWDSLDKNVQKWATRLGAIATIVGVLTAGGGWLIHQVDNAVASRIEAQTTEIQQEVQKLTEKVSEHEYQTDVKLTRFELLMLMEHDPENIVGIERLARHYFSPPLDGNSYMTSCYTKWAKLYGGDLSLATK